MNALEFAKTFSQASKTLFTFGSDNMPLQFSVVAYGRANNTDNQLPNPLCSTFTTNKGTVGYTITPNTYLSIKSIDGKNSQSVFLSAQNVSLLAKTMYNLTSQPDGTANDIEFNERNKMTIEKNNDSQYTIFVNDNAHFAVVNYDEFEFIQDALTKTDITTLGMLALTSALLLNVSGPASSQQSNSGGNYSSGNNNQPKVSSYSSGNKTTSVKNNTTFTNSGNTSAAVTVVDPNDDDIPF